MKLYFRRKVGASFFVEIQIDNTIVSILPLWIILYFVLFYKLYYPHNLIRNLQTKNYSSNIDNIMYIRNDWLFNAGKIQHVHIEHFSIFYRENWSQSYDLWIYSYNASVVVGYHVFQSRIKYFCLQNTLGYPWRCKNLQRWRCNSWS
jgi:hypothetical protein